MFISLSHRIIPIALGNCVSPDSLDRLIRASFFAYFKAFLKTFIRLLGNTHYINYNSLKRKNVKNYFFNKKTQ